jgi:hypothetical protein
MDSFVSSENDDQIPAEQHSDEQTPEKKNKKRLGDYMKLLQYLPFLFSVIKTFVMHKKHDYKVKTFNKSKEKIDSIENMMVKLEKKIREMRSEMEDLRKQIILSRIVNITLGATIIVLMIIMKVM